VTRLLRSLSIGSLLASAAAAQAPSAPGDVCARTRAAHAPDLHCIDLVPAPDFPQAAGAVEMRRIPSPFGTTVTADGRHVWNLRLHLRGLPAPATLGATAFVAWAATPTFDQVVKLGVVREGTIDASRIALNTFFVLVSAERDTTVAERQGRLVLRGMSPSSVMRPADFTALPPRTVEQASHQHGATGADTGWVMPPMHPAVPSMIPGLEALRPDVAPFRAGRGVRIDSLPAPRPRQLVELKDGDTLRLEATMVRRTIAGRSFAAYAFNGQWPGPLVSVTRASTITVRFTNRIDMPTTVHWHGIRLDNRFDGVPHLTQEPVEPGGTFHYTVHFPDAGIYWYHPHHREDVQQDLGLYGNLLVRSDDPDFFGAAHREEVLMLDDFLVSDGVPVPYGAEGATHALMGRFGNQLLVNGEPRWTRTVRRGEVVRFYLTNAANARPFNLAIDGARMKLVGGDVGKLEREAWVESVVLAPAERWIVDVRFERAGTAALLNRVQAIDHGRGVFFPEADTLGAITVLDDPATPDLGAAFQTLRTNAEVVREVEPLRARLASPPDRELVLTLRPTNLPFGLVQVLRLDTAFVNPVEWSGTMPMMDWLSTSRNVEWVLRDARTGRENMQLDWRFRRGELVRLRITNDRHTLHPMQHPIHIHGQRFLVLAQNGIPSENLVWKDTVMLPVGATAELLVEMSNPGRWMIHCHIAEHLESGMHGVFEVGR